MSSHEPSREMRAKPVKGGKLTCSRCNEPRCVGSAYCQTHRNEYQNQWRKDRTRKFHELLQKAREHRL